MNHYINIGGKNGYISHGLLENIRRIGKTIENRN